MVKHVYMTPVLITSANNRWRYVLCNGDQTIKANMKLNDVK